MPFFDSDSVRALLYDEPESKLRQLMRNAISACCVNNLTEREAMILMHRLDGLTYHEISIMMKISKSKAHRIVKRATDKIRAIVESIGSAAKQ